MNKYKVIGARDGGSSIQYCEMEVEAVNEDKARLEFLNAVQYGYDVLRVEETR